MPSGIPSSRTYANLGASPPKRGGGLKASSTFSNLPLPTSYRQSNNKRLSSHASTATSYTNATAQPAALQSENVPPRTRFRSNFGFGSRKTRATSPPSAQAPGDIGPPARLRPKPRAAGGIPRSRTFSVISNLTASLSRSSLSQFTNNESRRTSTSSKARKTSAPYTNPDTAASESSQALLENAVNWPTNIRHIYIAQSSAYWTGRFMALQDRFQSEMLLPDNLKLLVEAHAENSLVPTPKPPPTKGLTASATTSCITAYGSSKPIASSTSTSKMPQKAASTIRPSTKSSSPRKPRDPKSVSKSGKTPAFKSKSKTKPTDQSRSTTATLAPAQAPETTTDSSSMAAAQLLTDEDNRCHRIFLHLEAMCATSEARQSLHAWQQDYARQMGKESLLPKGGSMHDRPRELNWMGRLFSGGSGGSGSTGGGRGAPRQSFKRGSFAF